MHYAAHSTWIFHIHINPTVYITLHLLRNRITANTLHIELMAKIEPANKNKPLINTG